MLQLLLERGQSYEDIASLLGGSRDDVRRRARAALEELGGQDPDREIGLTDYILGQADPIGRADAVRHLQSDPDSLALAEELANKLRLIAPQAELPDLPEPKRRRRAAAAAAADGGPETAEPAGEAPAGERRSPLAGISTRQSRLFAAIGASALILLFVILAIAGVFGGGDDESGSSDEATTASDSSGSTVSDEVARIVMQPQGDSDASGDAVIGLANETQPFLELDVRDLPEVSNNEAYIFWFLLSKDSGFPLPAALPVSGDGAIQDRLAIPSQTLGFVVQSRFLAISIVDRQEFRNQINDAIENQAGELPFSGEPVLLGEIPAATEADLGAGAGGGAGAGALPEGTLPEGAAPEGQAPAP